MDIKTSARDFHEVLIELYNLDNDPVANSKIRECLIAYFNKFYQAGREDAAKIAEGFIEKKDPFTATELLEHNACFRAAQAIRDEL